MEFYNELKEKFIDIIKKNNISLDEQIITTVKLKPHEAIGCPERDDYPILKGKEVLVNAEYNEYIGQAYTSTPKNFKGSLRDVLNLDLSESFNKTIFIAALNAVIRSLDVIDRTIHCKDEEPKKCAEQFNQFLKDDYKDKNIALIGLQPGILNELSKDFAVRVLDLDDDNIGMVKCGVKIEHGIKDYESVINWADLILTTGSVCVNGSIVDFLNLKKPIYFYGTSIAGVAYIMNLDRLCFCAK